MGEITLATSEIEFDAAKQLFMEYADNLGIDLCFQSFDQELQAIPEMYGPPRGGLLLVGQPNAWEGCVGVRQLGENAGELKRMYLRETQRGLGIGRILLSKALDLANTLGYSVVRLDTLPSMEAAIALYRSMGFVEISPYRANPVPGALYFEKKLNNDV